MNRKVNQKEQEAIDQFHDLMVKKMKKGKSKAQIVEGLVVDGFSQKEAQAKVNEGHKFVVDLAAGERFTTKAILPALFGGMIGAAVGGGIWGLIVIFTSLESTWMASGIGLSVGFFMALFTKGKRGWLATIIAFIFSMGGILFGKYLTFYQLGKEINFDDGASIVWYFLALVAAWKMTSSLGIKVKKNDK